MPLELLAAHPVWTWLHRLGGPGLILLGIVDASVIPVPGSMDVLVIVLSAHHRGWWPYYGFMAVVGAVLGGYLTYRLAEKGGKETLEKKIGKNKAEKVYRRFERRGFGTIAIAAVLPPPFPLVPVLLAAGALQYPRKKFLAALTTGRAVRFFGLAYLAYIYGNVIVSWLSRYYKPALYGLLILAALGVTLLVAYLKWYRPKKQRDREQHGRIGGAPVAHKND